MSGSDGDPSAGAEETITIRARACVDWHGECERWAQTGECRKNPTFMHASCAVACARCPAGVSAEPDGDGGFGGAAGAAGGSMERGGAAPSHRAHGGGEEL